MNGEILFTEKDLKELKRKYAEAMKSGSESFEFRGHPLLVSYAKYLIEYLEIQFKTKG